MRRACAVGLVLLGLAAASCSSVPPDPLRLERGMLTVDNRTSREWRNVEIWLNRYFRVTSASIAAGSRLEVPLDAFVSGYAQRFDVQHMMITDLRLTATDSAGAPVALVKQFQRSGLAALGGKK